MKQTLAWPPQLNMSDNKPHIYSEFNTVERNNAPYLNEMLSPVHVKNLGAEYIHDFKGNKYHIDNRVFYKNSTPLFVVNNQKFIKEDVTDEIIRYDAYDIDMGKEAYAIWDDDTNSFNVTFNNNTVNSLKLFEEGTVVACRIRIIENVAYFVIYYDVDDFQYVKVMRVDAEGNLTYWNKDAQWKRQTIRRNVATAQTYTVMSVPDANPIINIGKVFNDVIGISIISDRGKALNTVRNCWITYFISNDELKELADNGIKPVSSSSSTTVINIETALFSWSCSRDYSSVQAQALTTDNITYYAYNEVGVKGDPLDVTGSTVMTDTGNTVAIDGVTYRICQYTSSVYTFVVELNALSNVDKAWGFDVHYTDGARGSTVDTDTVKTVTIRIMYIGEAPQVPAVVDFIQYIEVVWKTLPNDTVYGIYPATSTSPVTLEHEYTTSVTAGWLTTPNIVIDDGSLAAMWALNTQYSDANNWNNMSLVNGSLIEETGRISSVDWANNAYTVSPTRYCTTTTNYNVARSNSAVFLQNFFTSTVKLNNTAATSSFSLYNNGGTAGKETTTSRFLEYNASNCSDLRYYPGTNVDSSFNYFGDTKFSGDSTIGNDEDLLTFTSQGYRAPLGRTNWNLCYYVDAGGNATVLGISYSTDQNTEGTLVAPWTNVDDSFYIVADDDKLIYKDYNNRYHKISVVDDTDLRAILDDRYVVINTTSYWNCYDSLLERKLHYASDYNDRVMFGQSVVPTAAQVMAGANEKGKQTYSRYTATCINPNYTLMPRIAVSSIILPVQIRSRVLVNAEKPFNCTVEESRDIQPINVYYSAVGGADNAADAIYKYSIYPFNVYDKKIDNTQVGSSYTITNVALTPTIFTEYINGAGNNDVVTENNVSYVLNYYDQQPFLNYNLSSQSSNTYYGQTAFFVLQGQFYAFMNEKIYSVIYNNGVIASQDAIIDARGMIFVGNNPQIAFFYSPSKRMFYSFTGDAILQKVYDASKLFYTDADKTKHWYDEMTQSIYVAFPQGLLVFGQANTYLFENFKNVTNVQVSNDGVTHITDNDVTYDLVYYETEGYEPLPVELETSFYGIGSNEYTSIDRWDVTLFGESKKPSYIKVGVRSITDVTVKSEEKTYKITPDMYDEWSNSILIRYVPKLQKGQGLRLYVETPLTIQKIVPHITDMGTGTVTRRGI